MALVCTHLQQHDNMRPLSLVSAVSGLNTISGHPLTHLVWPGETSGVTQTGVRVTSDQDNGAPASVMQFQV